MLDEPTTGLHFDDIVKLLAAFRKLLLAGHSLLVIEHNLDVLKTADWIIDLGPEGGDAGGYVVAVGHARARRDRRAFVHRSAPARACWRPAATMRTPIALMSARNLRWPSFKWLAIALLALGGMSDRDRCGRPASRNWQDVIRNLRHPDPDIRLEVDAAAWRGRVRRRQPSRSRRLIARSRRSRAGGRDRRGARLLPDRPRRPDTDPRVRRIEKPRAGGLRSGAAAARRAGCAGRHRRSADRRDARRERANPVRRGPRARRHRRAAAPGLSGDGARRRARSLRSDHPRGDRARARAAARRRSRGQAAGRARRLQRDGPAVRRRSARRDSRRTARRSRSSASSPSGRGAMPGTGAARAGADGARAVARPSSGIA